MDIFDLKSSSKTMGMFVVAFIFLGVLTFTVDGQSSCVPQPPSYTFAAMRAANQPNPNQYFVIGGMFDIHNKGTNAYQCDAELSDIGFINMVAFFWGINYFFNQIMGARPVSVGAVAFDNCMRSEMTISNMYDYATCRVGFENLQKENLVAYVGPYMNEDATQAGSLAASLGITDFSPMADSSDLNFMNQKTLLKMRPSFSYDLQAIVAFLNKVNGSFVIIVYSGSDPFWKDAYDELTGLITNSATTPPCIQYTADMDMIQVSSIADALNNRVKSKYIVPLVSKPKLDTLMTALYNRSLSGYNFILTSRIGLDLQLLSSRSLIANTTIVIDSTMPSDAQTMSLMDEFSKFLGSLNASNTLPGLTDGMGKAWITEYINRRNMIQPLNGSTVISPLKLSVYRTLLSVNAIIKGMDTVMASCGSANNYQFCDQYRNQNDALYTTLKNALGLHMTNSGDLNYNNIMYTYYVFIANSFTTYFSQIGTMTVNNNGGINVNINNLKDFGTYGYSFSDPSCPNPGRGECCEVMTTTVAPTTAATGTMGSTVPAQTTPSRYSKVDYPSGQVITGAFNNTERMDSEYGTRFDIGQKWIIALGVLAGLGILCVIVFEIYILYKLLGTPMGNRWRTLWLGQLLLFGIFLCYLVLFAYLPIPTKATCGITRFGVGVSYAFCFAVLLVKLMVILTSKPSEVLMPGDLETPNYLKGTYQFLMFIFAVGVQVVIDVQWLITVPPEAVPVTSNNGDTRVWICNHYTWQAGGDMNSMSSFVRTEFENHIMSLIYIMVMILITTVLSLRSHGIITNHRESIFVGIASGFTIPIWLAWGLVGGLNKDHDYAQEFGDAAIAFGLLATATLILFSMFLPKVRHLVNMGVEGIYLEDDRETIYGGSVILAPPSFKSKGSNSVIYVNNQGIYSEPMVISNGDPSKAGVATHLKHPGSVYSVPGTTYIKNPESLYGGSTRVLRVTDDLRGRPPQKRSQSEIGYGASKRSRSHKGTLPRSRSQTNLGAL